MTDEDAWREVKQTVAKKYQAWVKFHPRRRAVRSLPSMSKSVALSLVLVLIVLGSTVWAVANYAQFTAHQEIRQYAVALKDTFQLPAVTANVSSSFRVNQTLSLNTFGTNYIFTVQSILKISYQNGTLISPTTIYKTLTLAIRNQTSPLISLDLLTTPKASLPYSGAQTLDYAFTYAAQPNFNLGSNLAESEITIYVY